MSTTLFAGSVVLQTNLLTLSFTSSITLAKIYTSLPFIIIATLIEQLQGDNVYGFAVKQMLDKF